LQSGAAGPINICYIRIRDEVWPASGQPQGYTWADDLHRHALSTGENRTMLQLMLKTGAGVLALALMGAPAGAVPG